MMTITKPDNYARIVFDGCQKIQRFVYDENLDFSYISVIYYRTNQKEIVNDIDAIVFEHQDIYFSRLHNGINKAANDIANEIFK